VRFGQLTLRILYGTAKVEILPVPGVEPAFAQHCSRLQCDVKWNLWFDLMVLVGSRSSTCFCVSSVYILKHDQQDAPLYNTLYYCHSTCFEQFFRSSSGAQICTCSIRYLSNLFAVNASVHNNKAYYATLHLVGHA
jgi:hypothetical protein